MYRTYYVYGSENRLTTILSLTDKFTETALWLGVVQYLYLSISVHKEKKSISFADQLSYKATFFSSLFILLVNIFWPGEKSHIFLRQIASVAKKYHCNCLPIAPFFSPITESTIYGFVSFPLFVSIASFRVAAGAAGFPPPPLCPTAPPPLPQAPWRRTVLLLVHQVRTKELGGRQDWQIEPCPPTVAGATTQTRRRTTRTPPGPSTPGTMVTTTAWTAGARSTARSRFSGTTPRQRLQSWT